jgi:hypothetical protein
MMILHVVVAVIVFVSLELIHLLLKSGEVTVYCVGVVAGEIVSEGCHHTNKDDRTGVHRKF